MNLDSIPSTPEFDRSGLLQHVLAQFKIKRDGDHGPAHWARVRLHGMKVGAKREADLLHGARAAEFSASLNGRFFDLKTEQLDKLCHAIQNHSGGKVHSCATIQSCWDGDRLDLGRVGIKPHKDYLSKEAGSLIARAYKMSRGLGGL